MNPGAVTLAGLALAVAVSCVTRRNVGLLALVLAWAIGVLWAGMPLKEVTSGFPVDLFLTLTSVTLLFSQASVNGTLPRVAQKAVGLCRGRRGLVPIMFFLLAAVLGTFGPGNIATAGLLAPLAMGAALRMGISPFLMAIMVGNGANASSLSPLAPTGVIVSSLMQRIGVPGREMETWAMNLIAHALVAFAGYFAFGGLRLLREGGRGEAESIDAGLERAHWWTLAVIAALVAAVVFGRQQIGMAALCGSVVLTLVRAADEEEAIRRVPWGTILMVCGVTVLVSLLEKTNGIALFANAVTRIASPETAVPLVAGMTGLISAYSSTSSVVLPAFLPLVPSLSASLGVDAWNLATAVNIGGHMVDVSPLSTIGALCIASLPSGDASRRLFNQLLAWGLGMTVAGAIFCWVVLG